MVKALHCFLCFMILFSCRQLVESKTEREDEPDVFNIDSSSEEMNSAMEEARRTMNKFKEALESGNPNYEFFAIKQEFFSPEGSEHIWVGSITKVNEGYMGTIDNSPVRDIGVKLGDTIVIDPNRISDWIYYADNKVRGGYTIRVIRNSLSEEEKQIFDYENGLIFDDEF